MSDRMYPLRLAQMMKLMEGEWQQHQTLFGISKHSFFQTQKYPTISLKRFHQRLETPIGLAAGPHTQLAQNIVAGWLCGARYIELKTVQILDQLHLSKPCIDMEDEGFNCEWSQELRLEESFQEYLKAFILIHWIRERWNLKDDNKDWGTIFNMSVGYNLEGILSEPIQNFIDKMRHSGPYIDQLLNEIKGESGYDLFYLRSTMGDCISDSITLSTMHGCPADEIEKIGAYLISQMDLHTLIKLNPTLLGPTELRGILHDKLGFTNIEVPDVAFEHDLKYPDAVQMIKRLTQLAEKRGVFFGLKLTNTLESVNNKQHFSAENEMMYMSGRALHPIACHVALKLQKEFLGQLDISFCAGIDAFNIAPVLACGLSPVTVCSDLLKPGGYERLYQYFPSILEKRDEIENVDSQLKMSRLENYCQEILKNPRYHKSSFIGQNIKTARPLGAVDCISAPCQTTCPTNQDVPTYMYLTAGGDFKKALEVIREDNPFPNTTGMACDHTCTLKCTRMNYDAPLQIREIKGFVASEEQKQSRLKKPKVANKKRVAVVGGGPSGLSAAYYLAKEGMDVEIYEANSRLGGMVSYALPDFRTVDSRVQWDIDRILSLGVKVHTNHPVTTKNEIDSLLNSFDYLYLSVGAPKAKKMGIVGEESEGVWDFLSFLRASKLKEIKSVPQKVLVIGGGNSAIDTVRSVKRLAPSGGEFELVYRRTLKDMPALPEEIEDLLKENIKVRELTLPVEVLSEMGKVSGLKCVKMRAIKERGKRAKVEVIPNSEHTLSCDMVIMAIGQAAQTESFSSQLQLQKEGWVIINESGETNHTRIYAGGDLCRGPKSIIQGIADGKRATRAMLNEIGVSFQLAESVEKKISYDEIRRKKRERIFPLTEVHSESKLDRIKAREEAKRCLLCDELCDVCVMVCPNRANISYQVEPQKYLIKDVIIRENKVHHGPLYEYGLTQKPQTFNLADFCNECGNCAIFCPTSGSPYLDKPKLYLTEQSFLAEESDRENRFFFKSNANESRMICYWKQKYYELWMIDSHYLNVKSHACEIAVKVDDFTLQNITAIDEGELDMKEVINWYHLFLFMKKRGNFLSL